MRMLFRCLAAGPIAFSFSIRAATIQEQDIRIELKSPTQMPARILVRVCKLSGHDGAPVVVINHGTPPGGKEARKKVALHVCNDETSEWFLTHGYALAYVLRSGYGNDESYFLEHDGDCEHHDYVKAGVESARQTDAAIQYLRSRADLDTKAIVVAGVSTGGWATIAYDSLPHPNVVAFINMAGGRGGHMDDKDNVVCHPERLISGVAEFGKTARTPMLWVYAQNDSFFGPDLARSMADAFRSTGGTLDFEQTRSFGRDGHQLFFGRRGSLEWGPLVSRYLDGIKASSPQ
jgi:dienelactone hydrolase